MVIMTEVRFTVRKLDSSGLAGAYRVHLDQDALARLKMKTGDLCEIASEDGANGLGIAWRALDSMANKPKMPPVKLSAILRETFPDGTQVKIEKSQKTMIHAAKVILDQGTTSDPDDSLPDDLCYQECGVTLRSEKCDALGVGATFDVTGGSGLKKRFFVKQIDPQDSTLTHNSALYYADYKTEIVFSQTDGTEKFVATISRAPVRPPQHLNVQLDVSRIGGLNAQLESLNKDLAILCKRAKQANEPTRMPYNAGILLHGCEGTGKTLLLDELATSFGSQRAFRIELDELQSTATKTANVIKSVFHEAFKSQPSLIIIDKLDEIAASNDALLKPTVRSLASALDSIRGTAVLVVAAARSVTAVDSSLIKARRISKTYELAVPDAKARLEILALLQDQHGDESVNETVASRTHGFTGSDLDLLIEKAESNALGRHLEEASNNVDVRPSPNSEATFVDGATQRLTDSLDTRHNDVTSPDPPLTMADFDFALTQVRPTALREIILETPKVTWNEIGGSDAMKARFDKIIGWPIHYPRILAHYHRGDWKKSVLLYGPPGCSKTMTAQAVANTYGLNFLAVKGAELLSMYVGESERAVREIFRKAKAAAPCIIFFDEIDAIGSDRDAGGNSGLNVLTTLLNEMDGFEKSKGVQVIAATNKPQSLDPALLRPGRFDAHVYLGPPNEAARRDILRLQLKHISGGNELNIDDLTTGTAGYSGAELVLMCQVAVEAVTTRAIARGAEVFDERITEEDLEAGRKATRKGITQEMLEVYADFGKKDTSA